MDKRFRKRKMPKYFFIISLVLFLFVGVGYSLLYSNLSVQGSVVRKGNSWSIGFSNPVFDTGSITSPTPTITNGTTMTMNVSLTNPGDKYAFTVDLKNTGNVPALIQTLSITQLTAEQQNYLRWKVEYEDESTPEVGDLLKAGETKKLHIYLEYKKLRATDLYPSSNVNLTLTIAINFYLPEETYNTVTLTKNGSTKTIQVSNLEQEVTLTDFPIESNDTIIACNNGVEPTTDNNDKIVLKKIKQNATCRIEKSLYDSINNSNNEKTIILMLKNEDMENNITVNETQDIVLDMNGKIISFNIESDEISINNLGKLAIKDSKGGGTINALYRVIQNDINAELYINGITLDRTSTTSSAGFTFRTGGNSYVKNSTLITRNSWCVGVTAISDTYTIFDNCNFTAFPRVLGILNFETVNGEFIIKNSTLEADRIISLETKGNIKVYLCNNTFISEEYDIHKISNKNNYIYYSSNNIFSNGTNIPTIEDANSINNVRKTDLACTE